MIKFNDALVDDVARAIFEKIFEDSWDDLAPTSIERKMYADAAINAIAAMCESAHDIAV